MKRKFVFHWIVLSSWIFVQNFPIVFCFEKEKESSSLNTINTVSDVNKGVRNDGEQNLFDQFHSEVMISINGSTILTKENIGYKINFNASNVIELDERSLVKSTDLFKKSPQTSVIQNVQLDQSTQIKLNNLDLNVFRLGKQLNTSQLATNTPLKTLIANHLIVSVRKDLLVVLTTCNQLKMTIFALEYLRETHPEADLLVVDDHSVDGTVDYLIKKGYSVVTKGAARGLTDSWNKGYELAVALGYKYLIFTNNDVLVSAAGVRIMKQELKREVLVVPLTSAKGAGHNPSQSLVSAYRLSEASEDYVGDYRHFELIQAALSRIARNITGIADPQDKTKRFSRLVPSVFRGKARFNGFFFGMNLALIAPAAVRHPSLLFDSADLMVGQEDHLMERLAARDMTPKIAMCVFIYHFKSVTVGAANIKALNAMQKLGGGSRDKGNDSSVTSYSRTGRNFRIKKEQRATNGSTLSSVHMDIRDDLRFYHPEFTSSSTGVNKQTKTQRPVSRNGSGNITSDATHKPQSLQPSNVWSRQPTALVPPPSYADKKGLLTYPDLYRSYEALQTNTRLEVYPGPADMVALLRERVTNNMVNAQLMAGSEAGSEDNGSSSAVAALDTLKSLQLIARLEREAANDERVVVGFAISDPTRTPAAGDIFTAQELGDALVQQFNVDVRYLHRGPEWYSPAALGNLDVLVAMLDAYDLGRALTVVQRNTAETAPHSTLTSAGDRRRGVKSSLVAVAWMRNWFQRWLTRPWIGNYDLLLTSSPAAQDFFRRIGASVGFSVQCVMGCPVVRAGGQSAVTTAGGNSSSVEMSTGGGVLEYPLISRRVALPVELLPLATNAGVFHAGNSSRSGKYRADYVFSGSYHDSYRSVMSFDPGALLPHWRGLVLGDGWEDRPGGANVSIEWRRAAIGRVPYEDMPEVYRGVRIVVDDANHVTRPWGSVNSRVFDALAAGALVVSNGKHGFQTLFGAALSEASGGELRVPLVYSSGADLQAILEHYLSDEAERMRLVRSMQKVVLAKHTYAVRAQQMNEFLIPFGVTLRPALAGGDSMSRKASEKQRGETDGARKVLSAPDSGSSKRVRRARQQSLGSINITKSTVGGAAAPPAARKERRLRGAAPVDSSNNSRNPSGMGPVDKASGRTSLCIGIRTIESQLGWLEILVRSMLLQYLGSHYSTQIELLLFVINTDQDSPSGRFHSQLRSMVRRTNSEYGVKIAHVLSDGAQSGPQPGGAQRVFRNPFYGYDSTDLLVAHMLALNEQGPSCEWVLLTNGDNTYNAAWFGTVAPRLLDPSLEAVAWDYVTHHKRGKQLDTTETAVTVALRRGFVDLGSVAMRSRLYAASGAMFLSEAVFTRDLFARDYFTFMRALNGVRESAVELVHKCLLFHQ